MTECHDDVCITCGDVAIEVTVASIEGTRVTCVATDGTSHDVAADLVAPVHPGDRLVVHAGVAIARVEPAPRSGPSAPTPGAVG
jgi:hydrogenase maturation factor